MFSLITFGRLALHRDGDAVPGFDSHRQGLAILSILAAEGTASRDRLMALLWPDSDSARARGSLKQALHRIRHLLGIHDLVQGSAMLSLRPTDIETDVGRFLAALNGGDLATAATLYAGPFLDGVHLGGSGALERWVEERRAEFARRCAGALEGLATDAETRGDRRAAVEYWRRLQAHDPTDGHATLRLMLALEATNQRAGALREAQEHRRRRREEWNFAPDPAVVHLAERLRAPPPASDSSAISPRQGEESSPPAPHLVPGPPAGVWSSTAPVRRRHGRALLAAAVFVVPALGVSAVLALRHGAADAADANLVAVAPFQVLDPSLAVWREGLADVLIRSLDGAGPLRTVSAAVALRDSVAITDRGTATALGKRTGAALVIYGSVTRLDRDTVVLRAWVLEHMEGHPPALVEVRAPEREMGRLADSLMVGILRVLGRDRPIASARAISIAARSLPALGEFLAGEQFYRRGLWDSALAHYDRAIAEDPEFGLALRRMNQVLNWGPATVARYRHPIEYLTLALSLNKGLGPRDSLLFLADSLRFTAGRATEPAVLIRDEHGALAVLEEAIERYPDDVEIWYALGENHYHAPPPVGGVSSRALAAFERAIALDPGFAPAYEHAVELAFQLRRPREAARYARTAAALSSGFQASVPRLAALVLDSGVGAQGVARALRAESGNSLLRLSEHFRWASDSDETAVVMLWELFRGQRDREAAGRLVTDSLVRSRNLARALAFRGRLSAAAALGGDATDPDRRAEFAFALVDPFLELALFGAVPDSMASRVFDRALAREMEWGGRPLPVAPRELRGAPWWLARQDTAALHRLATRAARVAQEGTSPVAEFRGRYLEGVARAYLALIRADSSEAAKRLLTIPDSLCVVMSCFHEKATLARLLAARGDDRAAADLLDRWSPTTNNTPSAVLAALERARIAERLSDTATALNHYRFVAEVWRNADPQLQQYVAEARRAPARLPERGRGNP